MLTINGFHATQAVNLQIGIETKDDTANYFVDGTLDGDIQGKDTNGIWHQWTQATNKDTNNQNLSHGPWTSTFSTDPNGYGIITFNHS